jgi:hypothetical protein
MFYVDLEKNFGGRYFTEGEIFFGGCLGRDVQCVWNIYWGISRGTSENLWER